MPAGSARGARDLNADGAQRASQAERQLLVVPSPRVEGVDQTSNSSVTGPSLTSSTAMWAPKDPRCAPARVQKRSYRGSACPAAAAATKLGRLPRRVSP